MEQLVGGKMQVYPDGLNKDVPGKFFGGLTFQHLLSQPAPRLFTTHAKVASLPAALQQHGKIVIVARNPKDALISQFFFFKKMAHGTKLNPNGNPVMKKAVEGGLQGCYDDYVKLTSENHYGSYWTYYRCWHICVVSNATSDAVVHALQGDGRAP